MFRWSIYKQHPPEKQGKQASSILQRCLQEEYIEILRLLCCVGKQLDEAGWLDIRIYFSVYKIILHLKINFLEIATEMYLRNSSFSAIGKHHYIISGDKW